MQSTRREWLSLASGALVSAVAGRRLGAQSAPSRIEQRIADVIRGYEAQGFHRTGTAVDNASGQWLADQVRQAGLIPTLEPFPINRIDPVACAVTIANRRLEAVPLFDGAFSAPEGVRGQFGPVGSPADIGLVETAVNATAAGALGHARRTRRHRAIVAITKGGRAGLCPSNADSFLNPFGPPVLQVSSEDGEWITEQARLNAAVHVVVQVNRTAAAANNIVTECRGTDPALAPLVVMTPRSGWYACGSERGGGIACWLEIMRALTAAPVRRSVLFVASSGHELGHLGVDAFIARRPGIVKHAVAWLHLGASIGAATMLTNNLLQASDDELDAMLTREMKAVDVAVARRTARGTIPSGEAEAVHRGGGRYVSSIGGNALFHNIDDHGPDATAPATIARFATSFVSAARVLA